jgi:hypothetical protein
MICMWLVKQVAEGKPLPYALPPQLQLRPEQHAPASAPPPQTPQRASFTQPPPSQPSFSNLNSSGQYAFTTDTPSTTTTAYNYNPDDGNPSNYF